MQVMTLHACNLGWLATAAVLLSLAAGVTAAPAQTSGAIEGTVADAGAVRCRASW